jgi:inosine-uridine nucleoside N-ribohydrolase
MSTAAAAAPARKRKVIIDTDAGCDDAIAILMALRDPTVEVLAFTSCFGNVPQVQATENIYTILRVFDRTDIPFFAGASQPMVVDLDIQTWPGHGANGLGDASFLEGGKKHDHAEYLKKVQAHVGKGHAVQALIDYSNRYPGEIDLIALGPLTNLALATRMDSGFAKRWKSLTVMGGSVYGRGNTTFGTEFNFYCDPDAAHVVLNHFPSPSCPVVIVPWEATEDHGLAWSEFDLLSAGHEEHIFGDPSTRHRLEASFLKKTHAKYEWVTRPGHRARIEAEQEEAKKTAAGAGAAEVQGSTVTADQADAFNELPTTEELQAAAAASAAAASSSSPPAAAAGSSSIGVPAYIAATDKFQYVCCDSYAVAAYLRPDIIESGIHHYAEVEIGGSANVRGMLTIDWYNRKSDRKHSDRKVIIVTKIHRDKYLQMMTDIFQPTTAK